jgi:hypothetical protein
MARSKGSEELMAKANAEKGAPHLGDEAADRGLLVAEPRIEILLPDILRAAHDDHGIEGLERSQRLALVDFDHLPGGAVGPEEVLEDAKRLDDFML